MSFSRRGLAGVATNAVSSVGNLSLTIVIAHRSAPTGLGRFAIAFALYVFLTGIVRASITDLDLSFDHSGRHPLQASHQVSFVGALIALIVTGLGLALRSPYIVATGLSMHGILLYDYVKTVYMSRITPVVALTQECGWTAITLVAATACGLHVIGPLGTYEIWVGSCALIGYWHVVVGRMSAIPRWSGHIEDDRLLLLYAFEQVVSTGAIQISTYLTAVFGTLSIVGLLRAGGTFFGPLSVISGTARSVAIPELMRAGKDGPRAERSRALRVMGGQFIIAVMFASVIAQLPLFVCRLFVGQNAALVKPLLLPLAVDAVFVMVATVAVAGHRARRSGRRSLTVFILLFPVRLVPIALVAHYGSATSVAWTMATLSVVSSVAFWASYLHLIATDDAGRRPTDESPTAGGESRWVV